MQGGLPGCQGQAVRDVPLIALCCQVGIAIRNVPGGQMVDIERKARRLPAATLGPLARLPDDFEGLPPLLQVLLRQVQ